MVSVSADNIIQHFNSTAYELEDKIGQGGFGFVYRAKQLSTGQSVAIKFLAVDPDLDSAKRLRYVERFEREAELSGRLQHPNIVRLLDKGCCSGHLLYAVFEYVEGNNLKEVLQESGALSPQETAEVMEQVLDALAHAHEQGVIHRDIKPANIMLVKTRTGIHAKVLDFGISTLASEARQQDYKSLTLTRETLGPPSYSAPEQLRGEPPTVKTDIFVWALVFIECLTGRPAVSGSTLASVFHKQLSQSNVPLPNALIGHPVAAVLRRALQKKVHERTITAKELYKELHQLNFSSLVGSFSAEPTEDNAKPGELDTLLNSHTKVSTILTERKQITVLAVRLQPRKVLTSIIDPEVIDALHRDQKSQCVDIAVRYGAHHVNTLADSLLFYFGYPAASENDTRLAARAVLDMISGLSKRNALLKLQQGIQIYAHIGMHTGMVTSFADATPEGDTPNIALELSRIADKNQVLCSENSRKALEAYIEFEADQVIPLGMNAYPTALFRLVAERQVEAYGFLRGQRRNHAFVGREKELSLLLDFIRPQTKLAQVDGLSNKSPATLHLYGEAGVGKSRLMFELRDKGYDYQHCVAQCLPEHRNNALYPIINLLRYQLTLSALTQTQAITLLQQLSEQCDKAYSETLREALPILLTWLDIPLPEAIEPSALSPEAQKRTLFNALSVILLQSDKTGREKKLFIFEDLHWADPTTVAFMAQFVLDLKGSPHRLVTTSREVLPGALLNAIEASSKETVRNIVISLKLDKLSQEDCKQFIQALFDQQDVATRLLDLLVARTDGIPLFIEELVDMLVQQEWVQKLNGIFDFVSPEKLQEVPNSLRDSLQQKLDGLVYAKETAQLAAALGREFDHKLLVAASDYDEEMLQSDLNELLEAELIIRQRKVSGDRYLFSHALIRDTAYDSLSGAARKAFHSQITKAIEQYFPDLARQQPFVLAQHYSRAEQWPSAADMGIQASQQASIRCAYSEAVEIYRQTMTWIDHISDPESNSYELQLSEAVFPSYMALYGLGSEQLLTLQKRVSELKPVQDGKEQQQGRVDEGFLEQWGEYQRLHFSGHCQKALALGNSLLQSAMARSNRLEQLLILPLLGQTYQFTADLHQAEICCNRAVALYDDNSDTQLWQNYGVEPKSQALFILSHILSFKGKIDQADQSASASKAWAEKTGCSMSIDGSVVFWAMLAYQCHDREKAEVLTQRYAQEIKGKRDPQWLEGWIVAIYDWAVQKTDFMEPFLFQLWHDENTAGSSTFYWPMLFELMPVERYDEISGLINTMINRCEEMGQPVMVPLLQRSLACYMYNQSGQYTEEINHYFKKGFERASIMKASWLKLDIATHRLECAGASNFAQEAVKQLKSVLAEIDQGKDTPLFKRAKSALNSHC